MSSSTDFALAVEGLTVSFDGEPKHVVLPNTTRAFWKTLTLVIGGAPSWGEVPAQQTSGCCCGKGERNTDKESKSEGECSKPEEAQTFAAAQRCRKCGVFCRCGAICRCPK